MTKKLFRAFMTLMCLGWMTTVTAQKVTNEPVSVKWDMNTAENYETANVSDASLISVASFDLHGATVSGTGTGQAVYADDSKVTFLKVKPVNGASDIVEWFVKPTQGLNFIPTKIEMYIQRFGTDAENGVTISAAAGDGESVTLGTYTAPRNNKAQADDKYGKNTNYTNHVVIELTADQQAALTSGEGLHLYATIGVGTGKEGGFANVVIDGLVDGELPTVKIEDNPGLVFWPMSDAVNYADPSKVDPEDFFSITSFDLHGATVSGTGTGQAKDADDKTVTFLKVKPVNGASDIVEWFVKPTQGLTFTPTKIDMYIQRFGTDAENGVTVSAAAGDGASVTLGTYTAPRNNKTQSEDKYGSHSNYTNHVVIELTADQQTALTSGEGLHLYATIGINAGKEGGFANVEISGNFNGELVRVTKYKFSAVANPEEAAEISIRPSAEEFEAGSVVTVKAERNFGYRFVNWTDATGAVVSETPEFSYTVNANTALTANFETIPTYELNVNVEGGANSYMVQLTPAPVVVENKNMYEEGTNVTLTALSNPIIKFTNWSDGQTSSEISMSMDSDKAITANFTAEDFVAGWDFYRSGSNGRPADFFSADNDIVTLNLRDADGNIEGWLDKSQEAAGGYEGRPAAVNWRTYGLGKYYFQTMVNASAFTDLKLMTSMVYNFNAYTTQNVEFSTDGETWQNLGQIKLSGAKNWEDATFNFPASVNNCATLYIRWISDTESKVDGTSSSNDGIALGASYILGTAALVNDGTAPVLLSIVPEEGSKTASINGKVVLTFDEKVKVVGDAKATLNGKELSAEVTGMTVVFPYKGLSYGTDYEFTLPAGSVADLTDNVLDKAVSVKFTTKTRPVVAKGSFDFIVPDDGSIHEAIAAAGNREDTSARFRIFIRNGSYKLPASETLKKTGSDGNSYPDPTTYVNTPNVSFIGETTDGVVITNTLPENASILEGIGNGDVLDLNGGATGTYFQNLTMKSSMGDKKGRDIVLNDKSNKTIAKDICLWGYQDTYVSNNDQARYYFEGGVLRGRTDFLCGKGDAYYNEVTLQMVGAGYLAVPSTPRQYGYVFQNCEIVGEVDKADGNKDADGSYTLGRPWGKGTPSAVFINTKMTARPSAIGWSEMSGGWPARFAEYNSVTASGTPIDLSQRKKIFADTHENNPSLTRDEAESYSYNAVMGSDDDWDPASLAEQAPLPENVKIEGTSMTWDDNDYVFCWAVCQDGKVIDFVTEPAYTVPNPDAFYSLRAANEMGGLGAAVDATNGISSAVNGLYSVDQVVSTVYYNLEGVQVGDDYKGIVIRVNTLSNGRVETTKIVK